jgi:hypothetical protein
VARYTAVWLELARDYYDSLPAGVRAQIAHRLEQLLEHQGRSPDAYYDSPTDQWTTTYGDGAGLIVFAVVPERQRLIILRLV